MFAKALPVLYPLFLMEPDADVPHAHNLFLQVGVDLGTPGLVAFVALLSIGLITASRIWHSACDQHRGDIVAVTVGLGVSVIAISLHGLVDAVVWDTKSAILLWVLLSLIAAADRVERAAYSKPFGEVTSVCISSIFPGLEHMRARRKTLDMWLMPLCHIGRIGIGVRLTARSALSIVRNVRHRRELDEHAESWYPQH